MGIINSHIDRLGQLSRKVKIFAAKGPAYYYTYGRWRFRRWLTRQPANISVLSDRAFLAGLNLAEPGLSQVKAAATEAEAGAKLLAYFQTRTYPCFFFGPAEPEQIGQLIAPDQKEATIRAADQLCENIFDFRRVGPVKFAEGIDWRYRPQGNIDWTWDLNRHAYFETLGRAYGYTGDNRYACKFKELLLDWLAKNPVGVNEPGWASVFEVAFRVNTWLWAWHYFLTSPAFDAETALALLKGLLAHGQYLDANLELHVQNNHLLLEAKALAMLGLLLPEFKQAERWRRRGLEVVYQQIHAQVCSDGVHGERATLYHRIIAGELLELLVLLENNQVAVPPQIRSRFSHMVEFELWLTKPDGQLPLFGDSALTDTYLRLKAAAGGPVFLNCPDLQAIAPPLDEAAIWLLGPERSRKQAPASDSSFELNSRAFPEGGYMIMRSGHGPQAAFLAFDCGPFGHKPVPSHGHADALSFELHALGQTHVVDPGVYSTRLGHDWRNFFRGSSAHNTVVVDNQDQSTLVDIWRVDRPAQTTLHQWLSTRFFDFVDGSHNGYERLQQPIQHRRQIFFAKPDYWLIIDSLTGQGQHCFDLYFHLMPGAELTFDPICGMLHAANKSETGLSIIPVGGDSLEAEVITAATAPIQGWVSLFSGEKQPAPTLRYRQKRAAPAQFCTILYPHSGSSQIRVTELPLAFKTSHGLQDAQNNVTSLRIETDTFIDYLVVGREPLGVYKFLAHYETDAPLLYARQKKDRSDLGAVIVGAKHPLLFQGQRFREMETLGEDFILYRN